jgi:L-ribulose-5-phosphate 4-epimerase
MHTELRERVFDANMAIVRAGLVALTFGNASGVDRGAGVLAIKPSGIDYDDLSPEQMVIVDLEQGIVVDGAHRPSSDTPTHLALYRHYDQIGGVVHTHSPFAVAWAQALRAIPALGTTHADHFHGPVPVTRLLSTKEIAGDYEARTGDAIVEVIDERESGPLAVPGALVASHGPFAWGADTVAAVENAVALELVAELAYRTVALRPDGTSIGQSLLDRHFTRKHGPDAYYGQQ